jgi:fructokinase
VSEEDLDWLDPLEPPTVAARALLVPGAVALVTLGEAGALVVPQDGEPVAVEAPPVDVVDTIGAGDAFMGGFLAWWHHRGLVRAELADINEVTDAAAFACRVAAETCARAGADPPRLAL